MWNYNYIIPSFMVLAVFLIYYLSLPHFSVRKNRTFLWILATESLVMLFDILSSRADEHYMDLSAGILYGLNMVYFLLYLARAYLFFRFTADILHLKSSDTPWVTRLCRAALVLGELVTLSSFWTGAVFEIGSEGYRRGPLYFSLYVCFFLCIGLSVYLLSVYRHRLNRFELLSAYSYQMLLLAGNIVRILLPNYLVMHIFCLLATIIIYLSFENPDLYIEYRGKAFNLRAFREMLDEMIGRKPYRMLAFALCNYNDTRGIYGGTQMDRGVTLISRFLKEKYPALTVFYLRSGRFALLGTEEMDWNRIREEIYGRFQNSWKADDMELNLNVAFVQAGSDSRIDTVDRVVNDLYLALEKAGQMEEYKDGLAALENILEIDHQMDVKRSLEKALEQNEVEVFLQPLVDAKTRKVVCAEALARIRDEQGRLIMPGVFIPFAEKSGRITQLGEQVFEKTCRFLHDYDPNLPGIAWINVNLSPIQCMRKDLTERFSMILDQYKIDASQIHLEITEESMVDFALMLKQIQRLQRQGFCFVLDDYGSGYSNLTRVKHYPFINIKLDMEVVWDYFKERDTFLPTIVQAFKQMNFSVTAEGIETEEMADAMTAIGCDYLQGFYFSKPLPPDEFIKKYAA